MSKRDSRGAIDLLVPGDPATLTGGYVYDRRILEGLGKRGWLTAVHALDPSFPRPRIPALSDARRVLDSLPSGRIVVIDGLALGGLPRALEPHAERLKLVALIHHPLALETGLDATVARRLYDAERAALALVRRVIATSEWTARALGEYGVPRAKVRVVEPGVDAISRARTRSRSRSVHARGALGSKHCGGAVASARRNDSVGRAFNLLCVATVTPRKGHAVLIEALASLRDRRWHLTCAGSLTRDPSTSEALRRQIDRLRLGARISLLGEVDTEALERHYARADLFVLASYLEGYGMALAEALAHGVPVISTTCGAIPETVPSNAGSLVRPGDSRALTKALANVLDDPALYARLSRGARTARRALSGWDQAAARFAAALEDLAA